jgi:hypothetical protein
MTEQEDRLYELAVEEMNTRRSDNQDRIQSELSTAIEAEEMNLFVLLKPSLQKDGNQWCVLYGSNLQEGIAGFGASPMKAIWDFNKEFAKELPNQEPKEMFNGTREALNQL